MTHEEIQGRILSIAQHLAPVNRDADAFDAARERNWLDHNGAPTRLGEDLVRAMEQQSGTRTVFRQVA